MIYPKLSSKKFTFSIWSRKLLPIHKQPFRGVLSKRCSENIHQIYKRIPILKCDFHKVAKQLYWNHTSAWVFSYEFAAYFQNTFSRNNSGWLLLKFRSQCKLFSQIIILIRFDNSSIRKHKNIRDNINRKIVLW